MAIPSSVGNNSSGSAPQGDPKATAGVTNTPAPRPLSVVPPATPANPVTPQPNAQPRPANAAPGQGSAPALGPQARKLKKGELLFTEGEYSRAMYFLKTGVIRLFKKKGDTHIELDTIHSGQVLGELAFLDGNPRSASGEALTECELIEISGPTFQDILSRMPEWLKIMLKTVVGRLRTASTRIRQLEQASTSYDYSEKDGKRTSHYVYMNPTDVMKVAAGILLVSARNGKQSPEGTDVRINLVQRYVNQIMGVPVAKINSLIDILAQTGTMVIEEPAANGTGGRTLLKDINFLEQLIAYLNEENLAEPSKRKDISIKGYLVMSLIAKHLGGCKKDEVSGIAKINLGEIRVKETQPGGREPFRIDEAGELVKSGYISEIDAKSASEAFTLVKVDAFLQAYRYQRVVMAVHAVNEQKRRAGTPIGGK